MLDSALSQVEVEGMMWNKFLIAGVLFPQPAQVRIQLRPTHSFSIMDSIASYYLYEARFFLYI